MLHTLEKIVLIYMTCFYYMIERVRFVHLSAWNDSSGYRWVNR
jgi:hypothetical protein